MNRYLAPLALLVTSTALASTTPGPDLTGPETVEGLIEDLTGNDASDRLFAARELRRRARSYQRMASRPQGDDLFVLQARQDLHDLRLLVVPSCIEQLPLPKVTSPCADILGLLAGPDAVAPLTSALANEQRRRVRKRLMQALSQVNEPTESP